MSEAPNEAWTRMSAFILWSNVERVSMVRYVATVVAIPNPDRPAEEAECTCRVFATQTAAIKWCADTVHEYGHRLAERGDSITRTELAG
jgi:hypothetical protein